MEGFTSDEDEDELELESNMLSAEEFSGKRSEEMLDMTPTLYKQALKESPDSAYFNGNSVPQSLSNGSNSNGFVGDGSPEKLKQVRILSPRYDNGHVEERNRTPSSCISYKSRKPTPPRGSSWRKIQMHEGYSLPLDEVRMAAMQGNLPVVRSLIKQGIAVDQILKSGWTCLMYACSCGKPKIVEFLLQQTADPNLHKELFTPLMAACASSRESEGDLLECVELLLNYGAKVDTAERHHMTALMFASKEGRHNIVQRLLKAKVDINKQDNKGWTALCWAATKGHGKVVQTLLGHSADPAKMNNHGQRPADIASLAGYPEIADVLERVSVGGMLGSDSLSTLNGISGKNAHKLSSDTTQVFGELEMVLAGLDLSHLITLFQEHKVSFEMFLRLSEKDLENMNVTSVGVQKTILHAINEINKREWKTSSLPNLVMDKNITVPEAVAVIANMNKHIRYMHASVGYLRDQLQSNPRLLQLGQEVYSVSTLASQCGDSMKYVLSLHEELKFFKCHLDKISGNAEFSPADLIVDCTSNGRVWQRRLLALCVTTTAITTVAWYSRAHIFAWIFDIK